MTEPELEVIAGKRSDAIKHSGDEPVSDRQTTLNEQPASRLLLAEASRSSSRGISMSDLRRESGDHPEINLEERLARDRIQLLHDVFDTSHGSGGLSMERFRSTMREVLGREIEDSELDKVAVIPSL